MRVVQQALDASPQAQALVMLPEINLTPQLQERFEARFAPPFGAQAVVSMHSGMTDVQRLKSWLAAHTGHARTALRTPMSVSPSMPGLQVIVVDEDMTPATNSKKVPATPPVIWHCGAAMTAAPKSSWAAPPSLESWHASDPAVGRYLRLHMPSRIGAGALPACAW